MVNCLVGFLGFGVCILTTFNVFLSLIFSLLLFSDILLNEVTYKLVLSSWIFSDSISVNWSFCFDSLTSIMLIVVTFISTLVHLYSMNTCVMILIYNVSIRIFTIHFFYAYFNYRKQFFTNVCRLRCRFVFLFTN